MVGSTVVPPRFRGTRVHNEGKIEPRVTAIREVQVEREVRVVDDQITGSLTKTTYVVRLQEVGT